MPSPLLFQFRIRTYSTWIPEQFARVKYPAALLRCKFDAPLRQFAARYLTQLLQQELTALPPLFPTFLLSSTSLLREILSTV